MGKHHYITIEEKKRFSASQIWASQREFYHQKGIQAWAGDVPFYITSNPFIASSYAELSVRFIQDWIRQHPAAKHDTFYILELGTGSGQFSYYALKKIFQLRTAWGMDDVKIQYIMSDFTTNNIDFWQGHSALQSFYANKQLDFAVYDLEKDDAIKLHASGITLTAKAVKNPMIVFANYIFDTIVSDAFSISNGELKESLVSLTTTKANFKDGKPISSDKIKIDYRENIIKHGYYADESIDKILFDYQHTLKDTSFLFPIGGLRCIQNLNRISNNRLLILSSDKGYSNLSELENLEHPTLDFHGSFSTMVNYHAIGNYFKNCGGDYFYQTPRDGLVSVALINGFKLDNFAETKYLLTKSVENFSPADFFNLYAHINKSYNKATLNTLLSFLCFSHWDPFIFHQISSYLIKLLHNANEELIAYLLKNIANLRDNFYYVPECDDLFFDLGLLYYELDRYADAIECYQLSEEYFSTGFESAFNIGLCYFYRKDYGQALKRFNQALQFKPRSSQAKEMAKKAAREIQ